VAPHRLFETHHFFFVSLIVLTLFFALQNRSLAGISETRNESPNTSRIQCNSNMYPPHVDIVRKIKILSCGQRLIVIDLTVAIQNKLEAITYQGNLTENSVREMMLDLKETINARSFGGTGAEEQRNKSGFIPPGDAFTFHHGCFSRVPTNYNFPKGAYSNVLRHWFLSNPPQKFPALKNIETNNISFNANGR